MPVTCFSSSEDKEIAYAQIRNQVTALQDLIGVYNRRHNDLNITARLPDDVLSEIFLWNRSLKPPGKDKPSWFRVAFVCTEWRRVAIDCATLWTSFSHENRVEWLTQVIIPRSKNALLSVNMTLDPSRVTFWEGAHFLLRDHSRRIREFGLNFLALLGWQPLEVKCLLSRLIANPLPSLEILHVSITGDAARLKTTCIPSNVLGEVHAPNLKSLTLIGEVKLAPVAPRVTLLITNLTLEYRGTSSVFEIISLLESSKKLQNLTLKLTAHSVDADSSSSSVNLKPYFRSPIVLRELKRFTLVDTCKRCLSILSSISCPAATNINVKVLPFYVPFESEGLVQKLATLIHPVKSLTIKVCTDFDETLSLLVRGPLRLGNIENRDQSSWESPPSANFSSSSSFELPIQTDLVELSIQTSIPRSDKTAFSTLLNPFDFQDLEILEMPPGVPTNILKAKFGSLSLLHTISIVGDVYSHATRGVVEALVGDEVSPDESRSWYLGVRNSRLNPRIVDVDAENEDLAIAQNNFLATIKSPLPFPALKCLKNLSTDSSDLKAQLGFACLLRQTFGIPLEELSLRYGIEYMITTSAKSSHDLDCAMIRQCVGVLSCI